MVDAEDEVVDAYMLMSKKVRDGSERAAMRMMASRLFVLEYMMLRHGLDFPDDTVFADRMSLKS